VVIVVIMSYIIINHSVDMFIKSLISFKNPDFRKFKNMVVF
jgi:hypothetical protein